MEAYALHLAVAALAGASVAAVAAYCMHRETLDQLLDFARSLERDRDRGRGPGGDDGSPSDLSSPRRRKGGHRRRRRKVARRGFCSDSPPDAAAEKGQVMNGLLLEIPGATAKGDLQIPAIPVRHHWFHTAAEAHLKISSLSTHLLEFFPPKLILQNMGRTDATDIFVQG